MSQQKEQTASEIEQLRDEILCKIDKVDNPMLLRRLQTVLKEATTIERVYHVPVVQELVREEEEEDFEIRKYLSVSTATRLSRYDSWVAPVTFYTGVASLLLVGAVVTALTEEELSSTFSRLLPWLLWATGFFYLLNGIDVAVLFLLRSHCNEKMNRSEKVRRLISLAFPPLRIGSRHITRADNIWIPFWKWCRVNEGLFAELKRRFIIPMIGIALIIVPVLLIEWKLMDYIKTEWPNMRIDLILELTQTFIWCAFSFEFLLMISVSNRKLQYVKKNWIDLLIILLPIVSFLRTLRISQIARLKYATRSFKLRGVITKARQGLIFMDFLQRLLRLRPESEIKRLYRLLRENQRDREELEKKLSDMADLIERKQNGKG